uniref:(from E.faecalis) sex pheromone inhibitor (iAD1) determinant protein n=1 Tax=Plasmid pAD1 TaxID=2520 RepID=Q52135_9ZZZZ|nr:ORF; putative [Plasmid pAD1]
MYTVHVYIPRFFVVC